jgi:hypothetical protein
MKTEKILPATCLESKSQKGTHPCQKQLPQMGNSRFVLFCIAELYFYEQPFDFPGFNHTSADFGGGTLRE